jgi:predicted CoA-binding protein
MKKNNLTVAVLGASDKRERYSNRAVRLLKSDGYRTIPIHPSLNEIEGIPVKHSLSEIQEKVDTLTVYINPDSCNPVIDDIVALKPSRVILNPGTEFKELEDRLSQSGIPFVKACTLVMLGTGQF